MLTALSNHFNVFYIIFTAQVKPAIKDFMDNKKALQNRRVFAELDSVPYDIEVNVVDVFFQVWI